MIRGELLPVYTPPKARFTGDPAAMDLLYDGLTKIGSDSRAAEMGGQPFICTPEEVDTAYAQWSKGLRQQDPEVRLVSARTGELAYRGLVLIHAQLEGDRAAVYGTGAGNDPYTKRRQLISRAIGGLDSFYHELTEAGHFLRPGTDPSSAE